MLGKFSLDLSLIARLDGHSPLRTHRGKERFPGMLTHALIQLFAWIAENTDLVRQIGKVLFSTFSQTVKVSDSFVCK